MSSSSRPTSIDERIYQHDQEMLKLSNLHNAQTNESVTPPDVPSSEGQSKPEVSQDSTPNEEASTTISIDPELHQASVSSGPEEDLNTARPSNDHTVTATTNSGTPLRDSVVDSSSKPTEPKTPQNKDLVPTKIDNPSPPQESFPTQPAQSQNSSSKPSTSTAIRIGDLQATYFEVLDLLVQWRHCLDVAIELHRICCRSSTHKAKSQKTIDTMNDVDIARRPYQIKLMDLNIAIENQVGKAKWRSIKATRVIHPTYTTWMEEEMRVWKWRLEQINQSTEKLRENEYELNVKCSNLSRDGKLNAIRMGLWDGHEG